MVCSSGLSPPGAHLETFQTIPPDSLHLDNWYYVDTRCRTGLIGFKEKEPCHERFHGSPLVSAFKAQSYSFSKYFFSDSEQEAIGALEKRLEALKSDTPNRSHDPVARDFSKTVEFVKQFEGRNGFFIVIDPNGF